MNHYVRVDLEPNRVGVSTIRVCAPGEARWKPDKASIWTGGSFMLACQARLWAPLSSTTSSCNGEGERQG